MMSLHSSRQLFSTIPLHADALSQTWRGLKTFRRPTNLALTFATIHEQPLPLPHYSEIGRLPRAASVAVK